MHKKLLTTFLVLIMTPAGCTALVLGLSFLSFINGHSGSSSRGKFDAQYEEIGQFIGLESADEVKKEIKKRANGRYVDFGTKKIYMRDMICEEVYRRNGKTPEDMEADIEKLDKFWHHPQVCQETEVWRLVAY